MQASLPTSSAPTTSSYYTRIRNCLCSEKTTRCAKAAFYFIGGMTAWFIPVPFLNGVVTGGMIFMGSYHITQHPDSALMSGDCRPTALSRNWKHITTGVAISGIFGGFSALAFSAKLAGIGAGCLFGGITGGLRVAYSNVLCLGDYGHPEEVHPVSANDQQSLEEETPATL